MSSARAYELCRSAVLAFGLVLAAGLTLQGQDSKKREPKRPKLDAGRDTNSAGAYHQHGMLQLAKRPQLAADAFYWAARLDPSIAEPWYGRWCALLLAMQRRDMFALMNDDSRYSKEVTSIDSLRYEALLREPLIYTNLDAVLVRDFFSAVSLATDGEVSEMDLAMVPDPATKAWLAYGSGRFGESVKLYATASTGSRRPRGCMPRGRGRSSRCCSTTARRLSSKRSAPWSRAVSRRWSGYTTARRCSSTASAGCARLRATSRARGMRTAGRWWRTSPSIPGTRRSRAWR